MLHKTILISFSLIALIFYKNTINENSYKTHKNVTQEKTNSIDQIIEENKGKVIYIDIWASWCKPCREEFPSSLKLNERYKDKVVFIYLSIDRTEEDWQKASVKESIADQKYNVITSKLKKSVRLKDVKIQSLPKYLIINKYGELVNDDAPRPSDGKIVDEFNKYIEEK